jgi:hypothetical protein
MPETVAEMIDNLIQDFEYVRDVIMRGLVDPPRIEIKVSELNNGTARARHLTNESKGSSYEIVFYPQFLMSIHHTILNGLTVLDDEYGILFKGDSRNIAHQLFRVVLKETFYHELSHIINGHLDALRAISGHNQVSISESDNGLDVTGLPSGHKYHPNIDDENRIRDFVYRLECDADVSSSKYMNVELARFLTDESPLIYRNDPRANIIGGLSFISCAISLMFLMFHQNRNSDLPGLQPIYPPPNFRALMIVNYTREATLSAGQDANFKSWLSGIDPKHIEQTVWDGMSVATEIAKANGFSGFSQIEMEHERQKWINGGAQSVNDLQEILWPYTFQKRFGKK